MYASSRGTERRQQVIRGRNMGDDEQGLCARQTTSTTTTSCRISSSAAPPPSSPPTTGPHNLFSPSYRFSQADSPTSRQDPPVTSPVPDVTRDKCVTEPDLPTAPVPRKSPPRITIMSAPSVVCDEGIFSADITPDDSSDEVTVISGAGDAVGKTDKGWKLRSGSNMDVGSDDDRDLDDGYECGSCRTDDEEDEVDESAVSLSQDGRKGMVLIKDDDSMMSSSISGSSNYGSCSNIFSLNNVLINGKQMDMTSERYSVLTFDQVVRLDHVMDSLMPIHGRGNFPTLEVRLKDLVQVVRSKLVKDGVSVLDIRLNGGAASHVLSCLDETEQRSYSDLDLIFAVDLSNHRNFDKVRGAVLDSLLDFLPPGVNKKKMSSCTLKEAYVHKMVKVAEGGDRWSLISLCNNSGRDIEIKFVDTMKRQFEFSVDSFQIILDSLLLFYECSDSMSMTENIYPTVVGESVYGNFGEALFHLRHGIIATRNPEEIRGGGLLKYCRLQVLGYRPDHMDQMKTMERYMCSRFFIDFPDVAVQRVKLANYLNTHFHDDHVKYEYLMILQQVVDESTVCLMGHERRQTLSLIEEFALHFYFQDPKHQMPAHPVIPQSRPHASDRHPHSRHPKYQEGQQGGSRKHAKQPNGPEAGHSHHTKKSQHSCHASQQQSVPCHGAPHAALMLHSQPPQQQQVPPAAAPAGQSQTLLLGSSGQFFYTQAYGNVTYQAMPQSSPHSHLHHHHHHCHNHHAHHHAHQNFGCFNCCAGSAGHCAGIAWLPCA